ncbi:hypothetical protein DICVIV_01880 [Dictyocaulus viviparus]|uniref:Uncharacterized protein n=1 Tax=Dictyocaulus viviparus TaxID=29172 RepID=A0A0D8Y7F1_DICVI|nr:hypothetical protein DICVIV_01880 [Dictyocaulus viviparus]
MSVPNLSDFLPMTGEKMLPDERLRNEIHIRDPTIRNALSEFFGTALLLNTTGRLELFAVHDISTSKPFSSPESYEVISILTDYRSRRTCSTAPCTQHDIT